MEKVKTYCQHRFSKGNIVLRLSRYSTRIFIGLVWCGVLWAFLTNDALPRQYVEYLMNKNPGPCIQSSVDILAEDRDQLANFLPPSWNTTEYEVVAVSSATSDNSTTYQVLLVRQSTMCLNILEFKGFMALVLNSSGEDSGSGEEKVFGTQSVSTDTVDVLDLLYPGSSTSLLDIPQGHFFALAFLLIASSICGVLAKWLLLPQLVGMIVAGFVLRNVPGIDFARHISNVWSSNIRNIALIIVLLRGGLSMDLKQLKRLKLAVLLLAFGPCVLEGAVDGLMATFWLGLPWQFGFTLGYTVAAISPSVVVPTTLNLQGNGYGKKSGIPTLIVGAASMDVVISISIFGIFLGLAFSDGSLVLDVFRAPIQIVIGLAYGGIFGLLLWVFPTKHFKKGSKVRNRFFLILGLGLFSLFGSTHAVIGGSNLAGSGALGALVMAFVAAQGWDKEEKKLVSRAFYIVWQFIEPLLFGLIGAAVDLRFISSSLVGQAIGLILIGLIVRVSFSYVMVLGNGFSWLEMCFVSIAWLPKATVQAAIGSMVLDSALLLNDEMAIGYGRQILTVAVLAVVLTAPLGAVATSLLGPVLLKKSTPDTSLESGGGDQPPDEDKCQDDMLSPSREINTVPMEPDIPGQSASYDVTLVSDGLMAPAPEAESRQLSSGTVSLHDSPPIAPISVPNNQASSLPVPESISAIDSPSLSSNTAHDKLLATEIAPVLNKPGSTTGENIELNDIMVITDLDSEPRRY